jgi:hypothetical protein
MAEPNSRGRGRPRSRRVPIHLNLLPEVDAILEARAAELNIPKGQYVERLVLEAETRPPWERPRS